MTLVIIDPGLHMIAGHHFELDTALLAAAAELGVPGHVFCHRTNNPHLNDHPKITPFFDVLGHETTADPMLIDLDRFELQNERLYDGLVRLSEVIDLERSTLLFPTASHNSLTGLARWVAGWKAHPQHLFVMLPGHFQYAIRGGGGTLDQLFYRYGFSRFPADAESRVTFLALSEQQVREYARIGGRNVELAPYPVGELGSDAPGPRPAPAGPRRILTCGTSRDSKGFALLPEVVRQIRAARSDVEFIVQYCPTEDVSADAIRAAGATVIEGYLDRGSYHAMIRSSDIMLLPYLGPAYQVGTSAVFAEARWFGLPVIAAAGTSMAEQIGGDARVGVAVRPEVTDLVGALAAMLNGYPGIEAAARAAAADYRRTNGTRRLATRLVRPR
jgi:glycosyltransferase involved in cell wall biosynthesis